MSKLVSETLKVDIGLTSQSLNGAGVGPYYSMSGYNRALFVVDVGAMADAATSVLQVMQATDASGAGAKPVVNNAVTITAPVGVASATITAAAVAAADSVDVNGVTFTGAAAADLANNVFEADIADDAVTIASLAAAINHANGCPGITATADAVDTLTLTVDEPGERTITIENASATLTPAVVSAIGYVECHESFLDTDNGFSHVALSVTNSAAIQTCAVLLRGEARYMPGQHVAASKVDVAV